MAAPDLPPPPKFVVSQRPLHVHLHTSHAAPESLAGGVVIVIDALRASVTIASALHAGAARVVPVLTVEEAHAAVQRLVGEGLAREQILLGGERGGVLIEGFDLDNSPLRYTSERVAGKTIVFTTTNGTASLLQARNAARILVGSFANATAVVRAVMDDPRPVHILCAGTRHEISHDDCLPAGLMAETLVLAGRELTSDDAGRLCRFAYAGAQSIPGGLVEAMRQSRGGRNLFSQGLGADVEVCSRVDCYPLLPVFDPVAHAITLDRAAT